MEENYKPIAVLLFIILLFDVYLHIVDNMRKSSSSADSKLAPVLTEKYNDGFNNALDSITLLSLELNLKGEKKTMVEMSEICRKRFNVPEPKRNSIK